MVNTTWDERLDIEKDIEWLENKINYYLNDIPDNITYSILPVLRSKYINNEYKTITISKSIKVLINTSRKLLSSKLLESIIKSVQKYDLEGTNNTLYILDRPWLDSKDFNRDMTKIKEVLDAQIEKETYSWSKLSDLSNSDKVNRLKIYRYKNIFMDNYGISVLDNYSNLIGYRFNTDEYAYVETYYNDNNLLSNKIFIKDFDIENLSFVGEDLVSWTDTRTEFGFIRELNDTKYYYDKNNNLFNVEISYNQPKFPIYKLDASLSNKIGTIDFETYGINQGFGVHQVYAAGFAIKGKTELFYVESDESSESFINRFFLNIFNNNNLNDYTLYIHNLGRFDSVFIIKSLLLNKDINITPIWKDNSILSLTINYLNVKITLLDSLQLIPESLENILESFKCDTLKGKFPYNFVNKDNLFYIGNKPAKSYYENITDQNDLSIPEKGWSLKDQTLNYLKSDIEGLLEAVTKFSLSIFNKYQLDITKFKTLPSLALAAYTSNYIPDNLKSEIKIIKGELEKEIRTAYFGGNVDVFINEINNGYLYDINSQYPKAMLNDMPIGDPVLSLEKDLNKIFGFVYGEITCPSETILKIPFIQVRDTIFSYVRCPRGKFKRLIFSEELKYALKFGYTVNIEYSYQFQKGKDLFKDYVNDHYKDKKLSKDPVQRNISKLFLNSLYGRLGINETGDTLEIVSKESMLNLDWNTYVSIISELGNNKYLVKYSGLINDSIRDLYQIDADFSIFNLNRTSTNKKGELKKLGLNKSKTVSSAVHIASAISSYARILINEYKNIPGNPCVMSDTDSAVLTKPLPNHLIGDGLGQMKLVHEIKKGLFIRKKLYYILDSTNKEVIKSSGIDSSELNYNSFLKLLNGNSVEVERINFNADWKTLNIIVIKDKITVNGLAGKLKTIYNTPDTNFKYISFPAPKNKYNLIVHPLYPIITDQKESLNMELIDSVDPQKTIPSLSNESDIYILYSKYEIILFIVILFISIIFLIIYTFFYN